MYRAIIFTMLSLLFLSSCHSKVDDGYFYILDKEYTATQNDENKIHSLFLKENEKYKETQDLKYLISSKYIEQFLYSEDRSKRISLIYELLRINNKEYKYITVACNFYLALEFQETSPKLSLQFLNRAIYIEDRSEKKLFLPHLYHLKGKWYYSQKNYSQAKLYFKKALNTFSKEDILHIASMYNNFAMCDYKMGNLDLSIKQTQYAIQILQKNDNLNEQETAFLYLMKGNLGAYYLNKKEYQLAEKFLTEELEFYKKTDKYILDIARNADELFKLYHITNQQDKEKKLVDLLVTIVPKMTDLSCKIEVCEFLLDYYIKNGDLRGIELQSAELLKMTKKNQEDTVRDLDNISDILNGYILKNINQEYDYKISEHRKKNVLLVVLVVFVILVCIRTILQIRKKNKLERELLELQNSILENSKENLEKDIQFHKGKIKNLHLNLNLKIETEKAFLENLKKMKKSKNANPEDTLKDLFFQTNNLLQIDQKNHDFIDESSGETKEFMKKLAERFSFLTESELKLCVYFRLNLSSKEVSLLENITPGSVRVYKTKLKYKIGLDKETDLSVFLNSIK